MATISVPDVKLRPAVLGSRGSRIIQRLEIDQRRSRMLNTLKQMGLDVPPKSASKRRYSTGSAESVRRSSDPHAKVPNDRDKLAPNQGNHGRRRSLMIENLQGPLANGSLLRKFRSRAGSIADPDSPDNEDEADTLGATLFPNTPFRGRSGAGRRLSLAPSARLLKTPRTSIEDNLLGSSLGDSLQQPPASRRRSRRGLRGKPRSGYLSTGQEDVQIEITDSEELERQKKVCFKPKIYLSILTLGL